MKLQSSHNEFQEAMSAKMSIVKKKSPFPISAGLLGSDLVVVKFHPSKTRFSEKGKRSKIQELLERRRNKNYFKRAITTSSMY